MDRVISARSAISLLALLLLVLTAGCAMLAADGSELPAAETVENRTASIDAIEATVVSTMDTDSVNNTSRIRMISRPSTGALRAEVLGSGATNETLVVSNGSTLYMYDRAANRVQVIDVENLSARNTDSMGPAVTIFDALTEATDEEGADVRISPLPVVPTGGAPPVAGAQSLSVYGNVSLSYEGTGTVDGRDAYVVEMIPQGDTPIVTENTYWFDEEWYYPIKSVGTMNSSALNGTTTMEYRNVTFNPDVPEDAFEFDIPANATVTNTTTAANVSAETYETRGSLAAAADRQLPEPTIPSGYEFDAGNLVRNGTNESITLRYTNGTESLTVSVRPATTGGDSSQGDVVDVDGTEARIVTFRDTHSLTFECGTETYGVTGVEPRETIVDVAESLDCDR